MYSFTLSGGSALIVFLDRFIEPNLKLDSEQLYRARVLVAIALVYIVILFGIAIYLLTLAPIPFASAFWASILALLIICACASVLWALRVHGEFETCAHVICGSVMLAISAGIVVTGGPVLSSVMPVSLVTIILAFVLSGKRMGLIWTHIVLLTHALLLVMVHAAGPFPNWLDLKYAEAYHIVHWLVTYAAIIGMMMIFDLINSSLKRERDAERERFEYLASHDPLTQLANRHVFDDRLRLAVARSRRHQHSVALFFIDLNGFKPINDKYGHEMGDRVLQVMGARLHTHFRNVDTVARLGGDEFAIIIEDLRDEKGVVMVAQKLVKLLSDPFESLPAEIRLGGSIGIALCPRHAQDEEKLVHFADTAMYQAKRNRENYRIFDESMLAPPL